MAAVYTTRQGCGRVVFYNRCNEGRGSSLATSMEVIFAAGALVHSGAFSRRSRKHAELIMKGCRRPRRPGGGFLRSHSAELWNILGGETARCRDRAHCGQCDVLVGNEEDLQKDGDAGAGGGG